MKPRLRSFDPFANVHPYVPRNAANDATTRAHSTVAPRAPSALVPKGGNDRSILETRYPGMAQSITLMWGYPEMNAYFDRLWIADGSQTPIDPEAMSELMFLAQIHQVIVPQRPGRSLATIYGTESPRTSRRDVWEDVPRRR